MIRQPPRSSIFRYTTIFRSDGTSVASSAGSTTDNSGWSGYWHIGWTTYASNWPSVPTKYYFQVSLAKVSFSNSSALTPPPISTHYVTSNSASNYPPLPRQPP